MNECEMRCRSAGQQGQQGVDETKGQNVRIICTSIFTGGVNFKLGDSKYNLARASAHGGSVGVVSALGRKCVLSSTSTV
jgi:hypothetical protein